MRGVREIFTLKFCMLNFSILGGPEGALIMLTGLEILTVFIREKASFVSLLVVEELL